MGFLEGLMNPATLPQTFPSFPKDERWWSQAPIMGMIESIFQKYPDFPTVEESELWNQLKRSLGKRPTSEQVITHTKTINQLFDCFRSRLSSNIGLGSIFKQPTAKPSPPKTGLATTASPKRPPGSRNRTCESCGNPMPAGYKRDTCQACLRTEEDKYQASVGRGRSSSPTGIDDQDTWVSAAIKQGLQNKQGG